MRWLALAGLLASCAGATTTAADGSTGAVDSEKAVDLGGPNAAPDAGAPGEHDAATGGHDGTRDSGADAGGCPGAGMALEFDGDNMTKVTADLGGDLPIGNASRTIELWAYFSGARSWRAEHSLTEYGAGTPCHVFGIDVESWANNVAKLDPYSNGCGGDNTVTLDPAVPQIGWLHLAWAYDGSTHAFQLTVNGAKQPIPSTHTEGDIDLPTTASPIAIGAANVFGNNGFTGKIDELRVWNVARSAADIKATMRTLLHGHEPGLVAYYHFDEGVGTKAADAARDHTAMFVTGGGRAQPRWVESAGLALTCGP